MTLDEPLLVEENDRLGFTTDNTLISSVIGHELRNEEPDNYNEVVMTRVAPPPVIRGGTFVFAGSDVILNHAFFIASDVQTGKF